MFSLASVATRSDSLAVGQRQWWNWRPSWCRKFPSNSKKNCLVTHQPTDRQTVACTQQKTNGHWKLQDANKWNDFNSSLNNNRAGYADTRPISSRLRVERGNLWVGRGCDVAVQGPLCPEIIFSAHFALCKISCYLPTNIQYSIGTHPLKVTQQATKNG